MGSVVHLFAQGGFSLATAGIVKVWATHSPKLSIVRATCLVAESLVVLSALLSGNLRLQNLAPLIYEGFLTAACATQLLERSTLSKPENHDDVPDVKPPSSCRAISPQNVGPDSKSKDDGILHKPIASLKS